MRDASPARRPGQPRDLAADRHAAAEGDVRLEDVSVTKPGQSFAFVMDTRRCPGAEQLAAGVDLLVIEATFLDSEEEQARQFGATDERTSEEPDISEKLVARERVRNLMAGTPSINPYRTTFPCPHRWSTLLCGRRRSP